MLIVSLLKSIVNCSKDSFIYWTETITHNISFCLSGGLKPQEQATELSTTCQASEFGIAYIREFPGYRLCPETKIDWFKDNYVATITPNLQT